MQVRDFPFLGEKLPEGIFGARDMRSAIENFFENEINEAVAAEPLLLDTV
jgi:hypothetical protein